MIYIGTCPKSTTFLSAWPFYVRMDLLSKLHCQKKQKNIHSLGRSFHPKGLTVHSSYTFITMGALGIELLTLTLLKSSKCPVAEQQENRKTSDRDYTIIFLSQKSSASPVSAAFQWLFISKTRTNQFQCLCQSLKVSH